MDTKKSKVYTKGGDKGKTSLVDGTRVPKNYDRIEAYGTVDELNSFIGLLRDSIEEKSEKKRLHEIQNNLFVIGGLLATENEEIAKKLPQLPANAIVDLEKEIDRMTASLPELKYFILPGGHPIISYCHIARTVCRRAERRTIDLKENHQINPELIKYLNRLSDYLFTLGRFLCKSLGVDEYYWKPNN